MGQILIIIITATVYRSLLMVSSLFSSFTVQRFASTVYPVDTVCHKSVFSQNNYT